eukprot:5201720-Amphidinium_carterae.1
MGARAQHGSRREPLEAFEFIVGNLKNWWFAESISAFLTSEMGQQVVKICRVHNPAKPTREKGYGSEVLERPQEMLVTRTSRAHDSDRSVCNRGNLDRKAMK